NGCASVVSALLATLLAIGLGFSAVVGLAVALYLLAAVVWRTPPSNPLTLRPRGAGRRRLRGRAR
ncbi:MAG: hypothetical protein V3T80_04060, partial [Kiloniellales bacterium]